MADPIYERIKEKKNQNGQYRWLSYAEEDWLIEQYERLSEELKQARARIASLYDQLNDIYEGGDSK